MNKVRKSIIVVQGTEIAVMSHPQGDYIPLTDMLKAKYGEFATIRSQAGLNSCVLIPEQRINATNIIGLISKSGGYRQHEPQ